MDMQDRITILQGRLARLRKSCRFDGTKNTLVYEEAISDLTTLIYSLEIEQDQGDSRK